MDITLTYHQKQNDQDIAAWPKYCYMVIPLQHGQTIATWTNEFSMVKLLPYITKLLNNGQTLAASSYFCCKKHYCSTAILLLHANNIIPAWPNHCCIAKILQHGHTIDALQKTERTVYCSTAIILLHGHTFTAWSNYCIMAIICSVVKLLHHRQTIAVYAQTIESWTNY
jgi:hypothetical protein